MSLSVMLLVLILLILGLARLERRGWSLSTRVLAGLVAGLSFGVALNVLTQYLGESRDNFLEWSRLLSEGYISLLKLIVMPLVLVSMIAAVVRLDAVSTLGRFGGLVIASLLATTLIAALVGALTAGFFDLSVSELLAGEAEEERISLLVDRQQVVQGLSVPTLLLNLIPSNIFSDLTGARPTSVIAVAIFG